jgi:WD40 repeat protein
MITLEIRSRIVLFFAVMTILYLLGCNSNTPVEYTNPHDPLSKNYIHPATFAPANFHLTASDNSGLTISWQDTNQLFNYQREINVFVLEKSINNGPFKELTRLVGPIYSYTEHAIDTATIYKYRIRICTQYDTSDYSSTIKIQYTIIDAQIINTLNLGNPVHSLIISPDGTMLAAAGASQSLTVWDVNNFNVVGNFDQQDGTGGSGWPFQAAFSLDNTMIATNGNGENNAKVNIWRLSDGSLVNQIHGDGGCDARSICFSNDGTKILTGDFSGRVRIWDIASDTLTKIKQVSGTDAAMELLYLTHNGLKTVVSCGGNTQIWQNSDGSVIHSFTGTNYGRVSIDENYLTSNASIMSLTTGDVTQPFSGFTGMSALTYDNRYLIYQSVNGGITVGQLSDSSIRVSKSFPLPPDSYPSVVCLLHTYKFFAVDSISGKIDLWELKKGWTDQ